MLIGLTGGIGSGKSTVAKIFDKFGIPVVDADLVAREVVQPGEEAWGKIVQYFGKEILLADQTLNRKKLGNLIFEDIEKRKVLNEITHPIIISRLLSKARELEKRHTSVVVDIPLLFESKREPFFELIIVVYVDKPIQLARLMARDNINEEEALSKISAQMSLETKKEKADIVIYNDRSLKETEAQVYNIVKKLNRELD